MKAIFNWSGGKDSALALHEVQKAGDLEIITLLTTVNAKYDRVTQHGVRSELLGRQAEAIGIPLHRLDVPANPTMETYNTLMTKALQRFKARGITDAVYGDIFLERIRSYREERLAEMGFKAHFPLWHRPTDELARAFVEAGFKAITVCVNERHLGRSFVGRVIDHDFLDDLPEGVDPCGEHGEFHSFVYDGPIFRFPVPLRTGEVVYRRYEPPEEEDGDAGATVCGTGSDFHSPTGFWFCDLLVEGKTSKSEKSIEV